MKKAFLLIGLSFEAALLLWFAVVAGQKLDQKIGRGNTITLIFIVLVLLIWLYQLLRLFAASQKNNTHKNSPD